jgi:hypothetical protein
VVTDIDDPVPPFPIAFRVDGGSNTIRFTEIDEHMVSEPIPIDADSTPMRYFPRTMHPAMVFNSNINDSSWIPQTKFPMTFSAFEVGSTCTFNAVAYLVMPFISTPEEAQDVLRVTSDYVFIRVA